MDLPRFSSIHVYYFSGTGNARRIALWILEHGRNLGISTSATNIEMPAKAPRASQSGELVGFVYPVHGFITIWAMLKFVILFPRTRSGASVFAITSLGGCKLGRYLIPGWEGSGLYLPMLILKLKGYRWAGACPMRYTPENWTSLVPGHGEESSRFLLNACRPRLTEFLNSIVEGKRVLHGLVSAVVGFAIIKISVMYLLVFRFFLAKTNFASSACNGCSVCENHCPVSAIKIVKGRPYWKLTCESCMRCMNYCPRKAVQAHLPFWFLLVAFIVSPLAQKAAPFRFGAWIVSYAVVLGSLVVLYWAWFQVLRVKWINRLFEYSAPTRYYRRYREPDTDLRSLTE